MGGAYRLGQAALLIVEENMFGWLKKKDTSRPASTEPVGGGDIEYHGLTDWWLYEFTAEDRDLVRNTYSPMGLPNYRIDQGQMADSTQSTAAFASGVAGWFNKEDTRHIGYKFIAKADEYAETDLPPMTVHFAMQGQCQFFYRWRDVDEFALDEAIRACERGISVSKEAAAALKATWGKLDVSHYCFKQLVIIEEKRGNIDRAMALSRQAQTEGWMGDWDARIARLKKKAAKAK